MRIFFLVLTVLNLSILNAQYSNIYITDFEKSNGTETATYEQTINYYKLLARTNPEIKIKEMGITDSGLPLHLVIYNVDQQFNIEKLKNSQKVSLLINNGIHPGEPDGIDASMLFLRNLLKDPELKNKYRNTIIYIIPIYNIGGALNRNSHTRVNQNGPKEYGFRGNARNFDLNRDFIKADAKNTLSFYEIFHKINPDVFVDTHVSNGADYQYTLTHLFTQHNKLGSSLGAFLQQQMMPSILDELTNKNIPSTPYVNVYNAPPDNGFSQFFDTPRYTTGYTTLFNTLGVMIETHMLKPYADRVHVTYEFLMSTLNYTDTNYTKIKSIRVVAQLENQKLKKYPIQWKIDSTKVSNLSFKGYEAAYKKSEITGLDRLFYNRSKPFEKNITYYNYFKPSKEIDVPKAYIIPKGWWNVIDLLKANQIKMIPLEKDTLIKVDAYQIISYKSRTKPYEGHFQHYQIETKNNTKHIQFYKGDFYIPTNQPGIRYLIETLEPEASDSFLSWNFFDSIFQEKEGFSPYVFEETAKEILKNNIDLSTSFEQLKRTDENFRKNSFLQLQYIYKNSDYAEQSYLNYPVYRVF